MRWHALAGILVVGNAAVHAASAPLPVSGEFEVNSYTTGSQRMPAVSAAAGGGFVVVWQSYGSSGDDTSNSSIQARRFSASGAAEGGELQVNSFSTSNQVFPAVSTAADGGFVVVWHSDGSSGGDTSDRSIQGQRYSASGAAAGGEFQVNTYTTGEQRLAAVSMAADGDFVVAWESVGSSGGDTSDRSIQGQRYSASGATEGGQFQVNSYTTSFQSSPAISTAADGDSVVVWLSSGSSGGDTSGNSIQAQRYSASGAAVGGQVQVNSFTTSSQALPAVSTAARGDFVVVWQSDGSSDGDTSVYSIQAQRYSASGAAVGGQIQVNSYTTNSQANPAVSTDVDGDFVVVWHSSGSGGGDTSSSSVQGQRYSASGAALGGQFQVNSYTTGFQGYPAVSTAADGDFVVVWWSDGSSGDDTSGTSVHGQRYRVTGEVSGKVFFDGNFNGIRDAGEAGIAGVAVELYDDSLTPRRTVVTDAAGDYSFKPKEGSWHVRVVRPAAYSFAFRDLGSDDGVDSDVDPSSGESDPFAVEIAVASPSIDAGLANGIGDKVWIDLDRDGVRDGGEPGLPGVTVRLHDKGGAEIAVTTSDAAGFYQFNDMPPGFYYAAFEAPAGYRFSPSNQGGNDEADSDADEATGSSPVFEFEPAEIDKSIDAGLFFETLIFADGFEAGTTGSWNAVVPVR